jgi:NAD(P)-dependent dehydrogenase (short-subunit alcohol dehydrogenase family)
MGRPESSGRFAGRIALVTGAGTGIGRPIAVRLAEEGAEVVVTSRSPEHVEETCAEVERASGSRPASCVLDVSDREAVERTVREVGERASRIDVLSNNAGSSCRMGPA